MEEVELKNNERKHIVAKKYSTWKEMMIEVTLNNYGNMSNLLDTMWEMYKKKIKEDIELNKISGKKGKKYWEIK